MNDYEHRIGFVALLVSAAVLIAVGIFAPRAEAVPSVAERAHLALAPRPPFVRTDWMLNTGSATDRTVVTRTWIYQLDCRTGAVVYVHSMRVFSGPTHGTVLASSGPLQVLPGNCLLPAGNASIGSTVVSTIGPLYRW